MDKSAHSDANPTGKDTDHANGEEEGATRVIVAVLHYKPTTDRELQIGQHVRIRQTEQPSPE